MATPIISVRNLSVDFETDDGIVHAVDDVSYDLAPAETLGIVGESGSGKSVSSMAILGLLPKSEKQLQVVRGDKIAMIFQDALASLNPVFRVGDQISEAITVHHSPSKDEL